MEIFLQFTVFTVVIMTASLSQASSVKAVMSPIVPANLVSLGRINGKFFFYDNTYGTWHQSAALCKTAGLVLAEIADATEQTFLTDKFTPDGFAGVFWTAGRDARRPEQFIWDSSGNKTDSTLIWFNFSSEDTCVLFAVRPNSSDHGLLWTHGFHYLAKALCQTPAQAPKTDT